jgi:hypothetical protein
MSETSADTFAADAPRIGIAWGDDITEERKRWLDERLTDVTDWRKRPALGLAPRFMTSSTEAMLARVRPSETLTGADVFAYRAQLMQRDLPVIGAHDGKPRISSLANTQWIPHVV